MFWRDKEIPPLNGVSLVNKSNEVFDLIRLSVKSLGSDCVIIGGGQKYAWSLVFAPQFMFPLMAKLLKRRVCLLSIGIEPHNNRLWESFLKAFLANCDIITVRDQASYDYLVNVVGVSNRVFLSIDPVFYYLNKHVVPLKVKRLDVFKTLGLAIRDDLPPEITLGLFPELIDFFCKNSWNVFLLSATEADYTLAKEVVTRIAHKQKVSAFPPVKPDNLVDAFSKIDVLLSTRLHFIISGLSLGVPIVGLSFPTKVRFLQTLGNPLFSLKDKDAILQEATKSLGLTPKKMIKIDLVNRDMRLVKELMKSPSISPRLKLLPWLTILVMYKSLGTVLQTLKKRGIKARS